MKKISFFKPAAVASSLCVAVCAKGQITVDGTLDGAYGAPLATQTINTGFGDSTVGDGTSTGGSELDAAYGTVQNGNLYLFLSGNFEDNGNHVNVFISDGRAGQNTLALPDGGTMGAMNGSVFSPGFNATLALDLNDYQGTAYVEEYNLVGTASGGYAGSIGLTGGIGSGSPGGSIVYGLNNVNAAGVNGNTGTAADSTAANAVTTGLEIAIPLSLLGNPSGSIAVLADINGGSDGYLANQFLPGLPVGSGNVGGGGPYSGSSGGAFNFGSTPGEYFVIPVPEPSSLALLSVPGLATLCAIRRKIIKA
ncbi:MAG TPA: hypothetical protein VHG89_10910 [Verrucomicrobiae bacterium]|nr:hypothetical protein [Verrucomicrobiae bacterium]